MRFDVLRHGEAAPPQGFAPEADAERTLTDEGIRQVIRRRQRVNNPPYDLVLASPTERTVRTAQIAGACLPEDVVTPAELGFGPHMSCYVHLKAMWIDIPDGALGDYRAHRLGQYLVDHGREAWRRVWDYANSNSRLKDGLVLVAGHWPFLAAMGWIAAEGRLDLRKAFDTQRLGFAEGYTLQFDGDRLIGVRFHIG